jgi:hypothetical protein
MSKLKNKTTVLLILTIVLTGAPSAESRTQDFYKCVDRVGGEWNYGRAPYACNANQFGDDRTVQNDYGVAVFDDKSSIGRERERYVQEMQAIIRDSAIYYLKKRKPNVSSTELKYWTLAVMATASHESYASHYRRATDGDLKMMRGDVGHGHGLMQVDDRSHFNAIQLGIGWNLASHLAYAMDIYYDAWQKAPGKSCVGKETNYELRARAAWSAYNGGPAQICRFTNPNSSWARNDQGFYAAFKNKPWLPYISSELVQSSINMPCLMEKKENCSSPVDPSLPSVVTGVLYSAPGGAYCTVVGKAFNCVNEFRDSICLHALTQFSGSAVVALTTQQFASLGKVSLDRHNLCAQYEKSLIPVGSYLRLQKSINIRETPGGNLLSVGEVGEVAEVLDFEIRNFPANDRYYKVRVQGVEGYVYAGNSSDATSWASLSNQTAFENGLIADVNDTVRILNSVGINMRLTPGGTLITRIPLNTRVVVWNRVIQGQNNEVYYKVSYGGRSGYIYAGRLLPTNTLSDWTERVK